MVRFCSVKTPKFCRVFAAWANESSLRTPLAVPSVSMKLATSGAESRKAPFRPSRRSSARSAASAQSCASCRMFLPRSEPWIVLKALANLFSRSPIALPAEVRAALAEFTPACSWLGSIPNFATIVPRSATAAKSSQSILRRLAINDARARVVADHVSATQGRELIQSHGPKLSGPPPENYGSGIKSVAPVPPGWGTGGF